METVNEQQLITWALKGNHDAVAFCQMLFSASQVLDDLYDGDKSVEKETVSATFWNILIALPKNRFYATHMNDLTPVIQRSLCDWFDANALEIEGEHEKSVAFVLRDSVSGILVDCAYLVGGYQWGRQVGPVIRKSIHNESLNDYIKSLEAATKEKTTEEELGDKAGGKS